MATVNLLPNVDISNSPAWTIGTGSDVYAVLADDDTGHVTSDSSDIEATAIGKLCEVGFQDHSLDAGTTINSVTPIVKHNNRGRGTTYAIEMKIKDNDGSTHYTESTGTQTGSSNWLTHTFTERTTSDGSTAWTLGQINALQMSLELTAISGSTAGITYAYFIVNYTVPTADNAVFFGTNF